MSGLRATLRELCSSLPPTYGLPRDRKGSSDADAGVVGLWRLLKRRLRGRGGGGSLFCLRRRRKERTPEDKCKCTEASSKVCECRPRKYELPDCSCSRRPKMSKMKLDLDDRPLQMRIEEFKKDEDKLAQVNEFVEDILEKARVEAETRQAKRKSRLDSLGLQNGSKKIGAHINKAKTSARTFASKVITAICNCTNTFKTAVVNRN